MFWYGESKEILKENLLEAVEMLHTGVKLHFPAGNVPKHM